MREATGHHSPSRRLAIVVPRYGSEIGGGAEGLARQYAQRLTDRWDVSVLTTCALDFHTWVDHYPAGESNLEGVRVIRFPVALPRDIARFEELSEHLEPGDATSEDAWMDAQGPASPGLLDHLRVHGGRYEVVAFIPYVYATTVRGLPLVADRSVLIPAFHDEPAIRLSIVRGVVESARAVVCSTPEERNMALSRFHVADGDVHLVGAGVDPPDQVDGEAFRRDTGISQPYVVVVGRVDGSKGIDRLIAMHEHLHRRSRTMPDLVLVGRITMKLPSYRWLHAMGFVRDETKQQAIAGAQALVCPSSYESLSLALLEAWALGVPTICSASSNVLVSQTRRAAAGLWYRNADEYAECVRMLGESPPLARALGAAGRRFARSMTWTDVIERLSNVLGHVAANATRGGERT